MTPGLLQSLNFAAGLCAVDEFTALCLQIAFLDVGRQRPALLVSPAFCGVLCLESATQHVFDACIAAAGEALVDQRLQVGGTLNCMAGVSVQFHRSLYSRMDVRRAGFGFAAQPDIELRVTGRRRPNVYL